MSEDHDKLLKFYKELEENNVDRRSTIEWLLTPWFYVQSKIVPCALGLPLQNNVRNLDRRRHNFTLRRMIVPATYPKYSITGVMSKDIETPSCTPGVTNISRLFLPRNIMEQNVKKKPLMIFIHGGGWATLDCKANIYTGLCERFCEALQLPILSLNYRLAPEHPYPIPLDDCYAALKWLGTKDSIFEIPEYIDRKKIIVCGDSAGGNITAAISLKHLDNKTPGINIILQIPIYPCFFKRPLTNSRTNNYLRYVTIVSQQMMNQYEQLYKPVGIDEAVFSKMKYVNCESASNLDDPNFPATVGIIAGGDVLRDEGISYFETLKNIGQRVKYKIYPNAPHAFLAIPDIGSRDSKNAKKYIIQSILSFLNGGGDDTNVNDDNIDGTLEQIQSKL
eukprot:g8967.t1